GEPTDAHVGRPPVKNEQPSATSSAWSQDDAPGGRIHPQGMSGIVAGSPSVDGSRTCLVPLPADPPMHTLPVALGAIDYLSTVRQRSPVELAVRALLVAVSVVSWALIAVKAVQLNRARDQSITFLDTFWKGSRLDAIYQSARNLPSSPSSRVFCAGYEELSKLAQSKEGHENAMSERLGGIENVERGLHRANTSPITDLQSPATL